MVGVVALIAQQHVLVVPVSGAHLADFGQQLLLHAQIYFAGALLQVAELLAHHVAELLATPGVGVGLAVHVVQPGVQPLGGVVLARGLGLALRNALLRGRLCLL